MKLLSVNSGNVGSTGKIMLEITQVANDLGIVGVVAYPASRDNFKKKVDNKIIISNRYDRNIHLWLARITGYNGCFSRITTSVFLRKVKKFNPDVIHLHNLHNCYINLPQLFKFIKKNRIKTVWTLHDCWAFTGRCAYFSILKCQKWEEGCHDCPMSKNIYPSAYVDKTQRMWNLKKKWFTGVENMTLVTPSEWLSKLVKESFLKEYPVRVINNGIDLSVFKPTKSNFRKKYGLEGKFVILGIAFDWGVRKGLDVFIRLAEILGDEFAIVLVGTSDEIDKQLPENVVSIHRTADQIELAEIYTACDLFVNPTREDNFPTVNIEALACGTPVLTFNTGGSVEIPDETCGVVVECDDVQVMYDKITELRKNPLKSEDCVRRAKIFDRNINFSKYVDLYNEISGLK